VAVQNQSHRANARNSQPTGLATRCLVVEHRFASRMIQGHREDSDLSGVKPTDLELGSDRRCWHHAEPVSHGFRQQGDRAVVGLTSHDLVQDGLWDYDLDVWTRLAEELQP
jgi:hypothetical protein